MRLLVSMPQPGTGGIHVLMARSALALAGAGVDIIALVPRSNNGASAYLRDAGVNVEQIDAPVLRHPKRGLLQRGALSRRWLEDVRGLVGCYGPAAAVMSFGIRDIAAPIISRSLSLPWILSFNSDFRSRTLAPLSAYAKRNADAFLSEGPEVAAAQRLPDSKVVTFWPIADRPADGDSTRSDARERLGIAADDRVLGSFSNLSPQKGIDLVIEHLRLAAPALTASFKYVVVGRCSPGQERYAAALAKRVKNDPALRRHVVLRIGPEFSDADLMRAFDRLLVYSRYEGVGTTTLEAIARQVPVAAVRVGSLPTLLACGRGMLIERSPAGLRGVADRLCSDEEPATDVDRLAQFVEAACTPDRYVTSVHEALRIAGVAS